MLLSYLRERPAFLGSESPVLDVLGKGVCGVANVMLMCLGKGVCGREGVVLRARARERERERDGEKAGTLRDTDTYLVLLGLLGDC